MLRLENLQVSYNAINALNGISLNVEKGKIVSLIGSNGAGKSTTLKAISGLVKIKSGNIIFNDEDITKLKTKDITAKGISLVPEGRRVFPNLTVLENLKIGAYLRKDESDISSDIKWVYSIFPRLEERHWQLAGTLSGGEQQMLAFGRAMMAKPNILMLDEPSLGLAPLIINEIFSIIEKINKEGMTILLIEQNANIALKISDYAYVLETGNITIEGPGKDLLNNASVKEAYLGKQRK